MKHDPTHPPNPADARALTARLADWRAFAAAAGATLAAVTHADASIIYVDPTTKPQAALAGPTQGAFAIDGVGLLINDRYTSGKTVAFEQGGGLAFFAQSGGAVAFLKNYAAGAPIAGGGSLEGHIGYLRDRSTASGRMSGNFPTGRTGFAGFKLPASKGGGEGWMRVEVSSANGDGHPDVLTVLDWAYNDAGGTINAGQEMAAAPEPSTPALALLAAGSAGVLAWRKRRTAARTGAPAALTSPDAARILSA